LKEKSLLLVSIAFFEQGKTRSKHTATTPNFRGVGCRVAQSAGDNAGSCTKYGFCGQCHNPESPSYNDPSLIQQRKDAVIVKVWAGLMAGGFASIPKTAVSLTYLSRVENATDLYHNFPRAFDQFIIQNGAWSQRIKDAANWYEIPGTINGADGVFQLGINKAGEIFHRAFIPF
jgi:hypothetical protein